MSGKFEAAKVAIAKKIDIPKEIVSGDPKITVIADKEITIENHKGIISFGDFEVHIDTNYGELVIEGSNFEILYLGGSTLTLSGKFKGVHYCNA